MPKKNQIGDGPVQEEYRAKMQAIAETLDTFLNPDGVAEIGFVLLVFPLGEDNAGGAHRTNYISNSRRGDIMELLREQLAHFERQARHESGGTQ